MSWLKGRHQGAPGATTNTSSQIPYNTNQMQPPYQLNQQPQQQNFNNNNNLTGWQQTPVNNNNQSWQQQSQTNIPQNQYYQQQQQQPAQLVSGLNQQYPQQPSSNYYSQGPVTTGQPPEIHSNNITSTIEKNSLPLRPPPSSQGQNQSPYGNYKPDTMTSQYFKSGDGIDNNAVAGTDGWDDWDWNDNNANKPTAAQQHQQFLLQQQKQQPLEINQPQQQHLDNNNALMTGDYTNCSPNQQNLMMPHQQSGVQPAYAQQNSNFLQQQQPLVPPVSSSVQSQIPPVSNVQQLMPGQQQYSNTNSNFPNVQQQLPPSLNYHPPFQQQQHQSQYQQNVINDSFVNNNNNSINSVNKLPTDNNDNWGWCIDDSNKMTNDTATNINSDISSPTILFDKISKTSLQKHSRNTSNASSDYGLNANQVNSNENCNIDNNFNKDELKQQLNPNVISSMPDDIRNTQFNTAPVPSLSTSITNTVQNRILTRVIKNEHGGKLTPQWSTESQMSHTSSDRSLGDSDNLDSRSSNNTNTSDEHNLPQYNSNMASNNIENYLHHENKENVYSVYQQQTQITPSSNRTSYQQVERVTEIKATTQPGEMDSLDQALMSMTVVDSHPLKETTSNTVTNTTPGSNYDYYKQQQNYQNPVSTNENILPPPRALNTMPPALIEQSLNILQSNANKIQEQNQAQQQQSQTNLMTQYGGMSRENLVPRYMSQNDQSMAPPPPPEIQEIPQGIQQRKTPPLPPPPSAVPQQQYSGLNCISPMNIQPLPPPSIAPPNASPSPQPANTLTAPLTGGPPSANPYKRSGVATHRNIQFQPPTNSKQPYVMSNMYYQPTSAETTNQEMPQPENSEYPEPPTNASAHYRTNDEIENLEIAPSNDRNQYLQTGHLSEEGYNLSQSSATNLSHNNNESNDHMPPPGLSRFVLGEPESENHQQNRSSEPPPGLDRMVPGNEITSIADMNMERQADGQVSSVPTPARGVFNQSQLTSEHSIQSQNMNITDRNLYLVPGESDIHSRVIPGLEDALGSTSNFVTPSENDLIGASTPNIAEQQREVIMDGENLQDQPREEPIEGADTGDESSNMPQASINLNAVESESNLTIDTGRKENISNASTCGDDSDKDRISFYNKSSRKNEDGSRKRSTKNKERYETEDTDYYSDRERRRFQREGSQRGADYREGSVRSERGGDRDERRDRDRRDGKDGRSDRNRDKDRQYREKYERDTYREKYENRDRDGRYSRYDTDSLKYEPENARYDRERRGNPEYDRRRNDEEFRRAEKERSRYKRDKERDGRKRDDRQHRESDVDRNERRRERGAERPERRYDPGYEDEYHRSSSRTASEKDRRAYPQNYYQSGYGYDPYSSYYTQQQLQYFEQLRRTNPQAYAEWYRKYYSQMQMQQMQGIGANTSSVGLADIALTGAQTTATDCRESVHSGCSSTNDKDRYNRSMIHQQQLQQQQQQQQQYYNNTTIGTSDYQQQQLRYNLSMNGSLHDQSYNSLHYQQQQQQQQQSQSFLSRSYYSQNDYTETRDGFTNHDAANSTSSQHQQQHRLTPCKFTNEHCSATLGNGLLVCIKPRSNGWTNIVKIMNVSVNDSTRQLYHVFPGPLIRGVTHKKTIIEFCEEQIRLGPQNAGTSDHNITQKITHGTSLNSLYSGVNNQTYVNRGSFTLMWNLLILLLRQNGMVVGTDISELLLKNKSEFPCEINHSNSNNKNRNRHDNRILSPTPSHKLINSLSLGSLNDNDDTDDIQNDNLNINRSPSGLTTSDSLDQQQLNENDITTTFRNYLLYGSVNEALDYATDNNLWGHALFLASKVDRRSHANVMMKFANKLPLNDPLQTLYQLMSGRTPSSVTSVVDEKWGDWRPHLAMILANTSQKPELDRKSITQLGDSLYNRGDLFGAQFCYLMAQVGFGKLSNVQQDTVLMSNSLSTIRLILLGSSHMHKTTFNEFATNESIIMTEIYEYACMLNDDKFSIIEFQPYKYLLATRMLDYCMQMKALLYMEQIGNHIQRDPSKYEPEFIEKVYTLADRLKYFDPVMEKTLDDSADINNTDPLNTTATFPEDQKWIQNLKKTLKQYNNGILAYAPTQLPNITQSSIADQSIGTTLSSTTNQTQTNYNKEQIDQQFTSISQQFNELNMQYNSNYDTAQHTQNQQKSYNDQQTQDTTQTGQVPISGDYNSAHSYDSTQQNYPNSYYDPNQQQQQLSPTGQSQPETVNQTSADYYSNTTTQYMVQQQTDMYGGSQPPSYDYWGQQQQTQDEIPKPTISMPNSMSNKPGFYDDENTTKAPTNDKDKTDNNNKNDGKKGQKGNNQNSQVIGQQQQQSGWFGGIWNKLSLKPKNQMILPDDKNPTIVWDPDRKKWINTDSNQEATEDVFRPPPKMADIGRPASMPSAGVGTQGAMINQPLTNDNNNFMNLQQQQMPTNDFANQNQPANIPLMSIPGGQIGGVIPTMSASATSNPNAATTAASQNDNNGNKIPSLQSNMFKMQRNRTLKNSYVDVFNPSGAPPKSTEQVMAPAIPAAPTQQTGFFIPGQSVGGVAPTVTTGIPGDEGVVPQFYNPNQYTGGYQ